MVTGGRMARLGESIARQAGALEKPQHRIAEQRKLPLRHGKAHFGMKLELQPRCSPRKDPERLHGKQHLLMQPHIALLLLRRHLDIVFSVTRERRFT